jgi:flagellar motor switch protein FliG
MAKNLTGEQKAAILLRAIGEEAAAQVMKQLDPKEIKKLGGFMSETAQISRDEEEAVISDFRAASASGGVQFRGKEFIKTVLTKALGSEKAEELSRPRSIEMGGRENPHANAEGRTCPNCRGGTRPFRERTGQPSIGCSAE